MLTAIMRGASSETQKSRTPAERLTSLSGSSPSSPPRKVSLGIDGRVVGFGICFVAFRQQDIGSDVHVTSPELAQYTGTDLYELYPCGITWVALLQDLARK